MMNLQAYLESKEQLSKLYEQQKYGEAWKLLEKLLTDYPYSIDLLVKRAKIIQLLDTEHISDIPSLDMAVESLQQSHVLAPDAIDPCLELGNFEYAVSDRPESAIKYFESAKIQAQLKLKLATIGLIKCYIDMGKISLARQTLETAKIWLSNDSDLGVIEFELEEYE
jgi:tetratricopeptide (TPR) repeat protein